MLTHLRQQRRLAISRDVRKTLSFEIVKLQRREVRAWKSSKLQTLLQHGGTWKRIRQLQKLQNVAMQRTTELPPPDAFADMLEEIFHGYPGAPTQPEQLDGPLWTCRELTLAIKRLKNNKATDECGLVAEVLRCVPHDCLNSLLQIMKFPNLPETSRGLTVLGAPIGSRAFVQHQLRQANQQHQHLLDRIPHLEDLQASWLLLPFCASPRCTYLLRMCPPHTTAEFANNHDFAIVACLRRLLEVDELPAPALAIAHLPLSHGGLGLTCAATLANPAFWSSWADSLPVLQTQLP